jgi:hypothetical protein
MRISQLRINLHLAGRVPIDSSCRFIDQFAIAFQEFSLLAGCSGLSPLSSLELNIDESIDSPL